MMRKGSFSDLPEYYVAPPPLRTAPAPPTPTISPSQALVPIRRPSPHPRLSSHLSTESRVSSRIEPRSGTSSRTSLSVIPRPRRHVNIGIDFGTTYSGVTWAITGDTGLHTIENWPNGDHVKVPTVISYAPNDTVQWGYSISHDAERVSWFKLLLAEDSLPDTIKNSKHLTNTKRLLKKLGKGVIDVTADYLGQLWRYAIDEIRRQIPSSIDGMPFRIVLGMPANWPVEAQDGMRRAAARAGILQRRGTLETTLEFVAEPEAAAIAAFYEGNIQHDIQVGDTVVICDAGGGTVDLVTYEVTRIRPSVTLSESIGGAMGLYGSIFLDEGFVRFIEGLMGKDKLSKLLPSVYDELMEMWELKIKRQFHTESTEINVRIPHPVAKAIDSPFKIRKMLGKGNGSRGGGKQLNGDFMRFSSGEIKGIFDPVLKNILRLVLEQRNETMRRKSKKPKAILLVGGLGGNKVLFQRLKNEFSEFGAGDIDILQPSGQNVWASICRGAAIKSMGYDDFNDDLPFPVVTSYISKAHYGMAFKEPFGSKHTDEDTKVWDEAEQMDLAWDQMSWYVNKGEDVSKGKPVEMTWEFKQPEDRVSRKFQVTIFECAAERAPTRKTAEVRECATIIFTANGDDASSAGAEGQRVRIVRFTLKMTLLGMGKVDFATYVNGTLAGNQDVRVDR